MIWSDATKNKLEKLMPRLASDQDGEIVSTVRAIDRVIKKDGYDWHDLTKKLCSETVNNKGNTQNGNTSDRNSKKTSEWAEKVRVCLRSKDIFKPRESEFLHDINSKLSYANALTPRQAAWLDALYLKATQSNKKD